MFGYAWRFFARNCCGFCGTQILLLTLLILLGILFHVLIDVSGATTYDLHHSRKFWIYTFLIEFGLVSLFVYPLFLALAYATLRAVQTNRFLMLGEYLKFFSQHYLGLFAFSALTCLLVFPFFFIFSLIGQFLYLFLLSFSAPLKFQYPQMSTCKAWGLSARISLKNWPKMLILSFLLIFFNVLSFLVFGVGLFISIPVTMAVNVYVYHRLVGLHSVSGYSHHEGRQEQCAYDGTGVNPDQAVQHLQPPMPQHEQQLQAQAPAQAQRVQYVQLVPVMRVGAPGVLPPPMVSAGAPGGPMMMMRHSAVQNV